MNSKPDKSHLLTLCTGTCGRMTRSSKMKPARYPNTVSRAKGGMCNKCLREATAAGAPVPTHKELAGIETPVDSAAAAREVAAYTARRRARLGGTERLTHVPRVGTTVYGRGPAALRPARAAGGAHQVGQGGRR